MRSYLIYALIPALSIVLVVSFYFYKHPLGTKYDFTPEELSSLKQEGYRPPLFASDCTYIVGYYDGTIKAVPCEQHDLTEGMFRYQYNNGTLYYISVSWTISDPVYTRVNPIEVGALENVTFFHVGGYGETRYLFIKNGTSTTVYFDERPIVGAEASSFSLVGLDIYPDGLQSSIKKTKVVVYAKDRNYVYFAGTVLSGADPSTFEFVPTGPYQQEYAKDSKRVYYENVPLEGADPSTFQAFRTQPYEGSSIGPYSQDAKNVYFQTYRIPEVDIATFEAVIYDLAKDKNHVYKEGRVIPDADPKTFDFPEPGIG